MFCETAMKVGDIVMYSGKNPTALRSRRNVVDATVDLMRKMDYRKITITQICKTANISRQTFYQFFANVDEVVYFKINEYLKEATKNIQLANSSQVESFVKEFFHFFSEHDDFLKLLLDNNLDFLLREAFSTNLLELARSLIAKGWSAKPNSYANAYLSGALTNILIYWIKQEDPISESELTKLLLEIMKGDFFGLD